MDYYLESLIKSMGAEKWNKFKNHKDFRLWLSYSCLNLSNMNREYTEEKANTLFNEIMEDIKEK